MTMAPAQYENRGRSRKLSFPDSSGMRILADWFDGVEHARDHRHGRDHRDPEHTRKSRFPWSGLPNVTLQRSPSLRSTTATASDSHGDFTSTVDTYSSGSSGRYSGFNSPIYTHGSFDLTSQIHTLLDTSTPILWDVRQPLDTLTSSQSISRIYGQNTLSFPLLSNGSSHILILSKEFPWSIEIGPKTRAITASDALYAIQDLLHSDLDDTVWGLLDENKRNEIEKTWKKRTESGDKPKNVDYLGKRYMFKGFYRDERFTRQRMLPGSSEISDIWLLALGKQ